MIQIKQKLVNKNSSEYKIRYSGAKEDLVYKNSQNSVKDPDPAIKKKNPHLFSPYHHIMENIFLSQK